MMFLDSLNTILESGNMFKVLVIRFSGSNIPIPTHEEIYSSRKNKKNQENLWKSIFHILSNTVPIYLNDFFVSRYGIVWSWKSVREYFKYVYRLQNDL